MSDSPSILADYLTEDELAVQIDRTPRTLERWRAKRNGPPVTYIGKTPYYHIDSVREWLKSQEQKPVRRAK